MFKKSNFKYIFLPVFVLIIACSTKKDTLINRNWHALNTEYNTLYNGGLALDEGVKEVISSYKDNFWEVLPVERMQVNTEAELPGQKGKNKNFERAEEKATKAIQKHSMNIEGKEKNMQMDEAYLMLGKARYYDKRFVPALEAFNYILYKYTNSDKIYEAKIWREKTNLRLENDALAIKNLKFLLKKYKLKPQIQADANGVLAQAFINLAQQDSAIAPLKLAILNTKLKEERARYHFILGQLYQNLNYKDSAYAQFQEVIEMKRKSPRLYVMQAHAKQAQLQDYKGDTTEIFKKYDKLFKDRENRPYHDILYYQLAMFHDDLGNKQKAINYYNRSLKAKKEDSYLEASAYRNLATIYFDKAKYVLAGKYYDSTLTKLVKKNKEYFTIQKKRQNLDDVIKYEGIVATNDSILKLAAMSENERKTYFESYITRLKAADEAKRLKEEEQKKLEANQSGIQDIKDSNPRGGISAPPGSLAMPVSDNFQESKFYFYNSSTVAYGKIDFKKKWGKRILADNWRWNSQQNVDASTKPDEKANDTTKTSSVALEEKYTPEFYLKTIPTNPKTLDSLSKERNNAYYELGIVYKEKFNEKKLAANRLETLLNNNPEERYLLPAYYNLYKIYQEIDPSKADTYKSKIINNYPNTRYAQLLNGTISEGSTTDKTPEEEYKTRFEMFRNQDFSNVINCIDEDIQQFTGNDIVPKLELLKASAIGKVKGLEEYKKAMSNVALTYPNTEEGKQAEEIIKISIPRMEQMALTVDTIDSKSWKVLYKVGDRKEKTTNDIIEKINKFIKEKQYDTYSVSYDVYNEKDNFVVIHGVSSKAYANYLVETLTKSKEYTIKAPAVVISRENYEVIQIKKNYDQFLNLKI